MGGCSGSAARSVLLTLSAGATESQGMSLGLPAVLKLVLFRAGSIP